MPRASLGLSLLLFTCLAFPSLLNAQRRPGGGGSSGGIIDVQVRYDTGQPGPRGLHIRLESAEGGAAGDCETREGGKCQFRPTSGGVYPHGHSVPNAEELERRSNIFAEGHHSRFEFRGRLLGTGGSL